MSCNTFIPIMDLVREVEALLAANYIDKDDPRITGGVFTNPTIKEGFLLDVQAREEFCRLVQECGLDAPFGKMWLSRPLYPDSMFVSYEDSGEPQTKWKTIQAVLESAGVLGPAATSLSSRLAAEIDRATTAENDIISWAEGALTTAVDALELTDLSLQSQVNSIGGGKFAYTTYEKMEAAAALPDEDPLKLPANSSVDVTNDTDPSKNGTYSYDGAVFAKSPYDPLALAKDYADANPMFLPVRIQATDNLDDFITNGEYHKIGSGDIDVTNNNYPVSVAGVLRVSGAGGAVVQTYTTFTNPTTYMRVKKSIGFTDWKQATINELPKLDRYYAPLEWQGGSTTKVSFDPETKKVTMKGLLVAAYNIPGRNLRISGLDITISGAYDVCYLDLIALGSVTVIDASNYTDYIKVGKYEDASYLPEVGKVPLFKYDILQGKAVPCAGFVPIYTTESAITTAALSPCYYQFSGSSLKVYSQVKGNLYVGFNVLYQFYDDDIIYEKYWRIANADFYTLADGVMTATGKKALDVGESEFVIKQTAEKKDFTGGVHGDEQFTDVLFLANGIAVAITGTVPLTACSDFQYIIKSTLHETTETDGGFIAGHPVIANHIKHTSFLNGGYKTYNKLITQYDGTLMTVYHGISCISKDVANVVMTDKTFTPTAMTGSGSELMREPGARKYIGYNTTNNLSATATSRIIGDDVADLNSMSWVSDRGVDSKYYRRSPVDQPVSVGDVFESEFECYFNSK